MDLFEVLGTLSDTVGAFGRLSFVPFADEHPGIRLEARSDAPRATPREWS
jgi:hypothetical protein